MLFGDLRDQTEVLEQVAVGIVRWKGIEIKGVDRIPVGNQLRQLVEKVGIVFCSHPATQNTSARDRQREFR